MVERDVFVPRAAPARRALNGFLARSRIVLVGQLDARGVVRRANRALRRWIAPGGTEPNLEEALLARSQRRWRETIAGRLAPGAPEDCDMALTLWFGRGGSDSHPFRCRLMSDQGGVLWLFGEPREGPSAGGRGADLERARRRAERQARTDPLTGLANRRRAIERLAGAARRARRRGTALACLMVDFDGFKSINDRFGHSAGDRVLRAAARALAAGLRGSGLVARYGGDEFLVVLEGVSATEAMAVAERLRGQLECLHIPPLDRPLHASFGIAELLPGERARGLLERADAALLASKRVESARGHREGDGLGPG